MNRKSKRSAFKIIEDRQTILTAIKHKIEDLAIPKGGHSQVILFEKEHTRVGYGIRHLQMGLQVIIGGYRHLDFPMDLPLKRPQILS
jgi:23S rRNA U2552 (ribose-2'-O)-methylase RlmE/FtsJ